MIVSASRRTDIPAFFSPWLLNRLEAGWVKTRNPFNPAQEKQISLLPQDVDCLVLWTKNPIPMLEQLERLNASKIPFYFQFTLTPYGRELEPFLPPKRQLVEAFLSLSRQVGSQCVIWRYDPIVLNADWTIQRHITAFTQLCRVLAPHTRRVVISFVDLYQKLRTPLIRPIPLSEQETLAAAFSAIGSAHGLIVAACCEAEDFSRYGIMPSACIDSALIAAITGRSCAAPADANQRPGCGCAQSVDIGAYNTCRNGCIYCYANRSPASVGKNCARHSPTGPFLIE